MHPARPPSLNPLVLATTTYQLLGTLVGVVWSALVYYLILSWNAAGTIVLGQGQWANLGAEGSHLLAQLFGQYGLQRIFREHPGFAIFSVGCLVVGILGPLVRRATPRRWRWIVPNTVLIGLAQFPPANAFSVLTGLAFGLFYQCFLRRRRPAWFRRNQMVSTSGLNTGVGLGGLVLLALQATSASKMKVDLGGPTGDGCYFPPNMPQF